jgi:hypothetical protein
MEMAGSERRRDQRAGRHKKDELEGLGKLKEREKKWNWSKKSGKMLDVKKGIGTEGKVGRMRREQRSAKKNIVVITTLDYVLHQVKYSANAHSSK